MDRRSFLAFSTLAPAFLINACKDAAEIKTPGDGVKGFPIIDVSGNYYDIGYQIASNFKENILAVLEQQKEWADNLKAIIATGEGRLYSNKLLEATKARFPEYVEEIRGMAEGCGLEFDFMWAMSIKSELKVFEMENPGCSTVYYKDNERNWLFHNEDGDMAYGGQMFLARVAPPTGVNFITLVYPGLIMGVGPSFNEAGIVQTTNYIGTTKSFPGIPRYFIGRAILESENLFEAIQLATTKSRAFPWHHNLASMKEKKYVSVETLPNGKVGIQVPDKMPYIHTNHLIIGNTSDYEFEDVQYKQVSSVSRYMALLKEGMTQDKSIINPNTVLKALSSRENAPYSPCRIPEGNVRGMTLGTAWFDIENQKARYYAGTPDNSVQNDIFDEYSF